MDTVISTLHQAADLTVVHGPDPAGCIRAAVFGRPDAVMPYGDTTESLLIEDAEFRLQRHINPASGGADEDVPVDEWCVGRSVADVRAALFATAAALEAGVR